MASLEFLKSLGVPTAEQRRVFSLAESKGFPELYRYGQPKGSGRQLWVRFCLAAHPEWLTLAETALQAYEPGARPSEPERPDEPERWLRQTS